MKFCERLKLAREHAGLTQQEVIDRLPTKADGKPLMAQSNLAKMEGSQVAKGSIYSVFIAEACGVSAKWLANEVGAMLPMDQPYLTRPRLQALVKVAQGMSDYTIDEVIKDAIKTDELIKRVQSEKNGTHK